MSWQKSASGSVHSPPVSDVTRPIVAILDVDITLIPASSHYSTHGRPLLTLA